MDSNTEPQGEQWTGSHACPETYEQMEPRILQKGSASLKRNLDSNENIVVDMVKFKMSSTFRIIKENKVN